MGRGPSYVKLLDRNDDARAILMDRLGEPLGAGLRPPESQINILCETLTDAWQISRGPAGGNPEEEKARSLSRYIEDVYERLQPPLSDRPVAMALRCGRRRAEAFDLSPCVIVHGDPHPGNALRLLTARPGADAEFVFVDPDGFPAHPTYDLGVVFRDACPEILRGDPATVAQRYCARLTDQTGLGEAAIWEWGFIERVSTGLCLFDLGDEFLARPSLKTADLLA